MTCQVGSLGFGLRLSSIAHLHIIIINIINIIINIIITYPN